MAKFITRTMVSTTVVYQGMVDGNLTEEYTAIFPAEISKRDAMGFILDSNPEWDTVIIRKIESQEQTYRVTIEDFLRIAEVVTKKGENE